VFFVRELLVRMALLFDCVYCSLATLRAYSTLMRESRAPFILAATLKDPTNTYSILYPSTSVPKYQACAE
jgi:hypothetical protein